MKFFKFLLVHFGCSRFLRWSVRRFANGKWGVGSVVQSGVNELFIAVVFRLEIFCYGEGVLCRKLKEQHETLRR
jgi:hypothetical protein